MRRFAVLTIAAVALGAAASPTVQAAGWSHAAGFDVHGAYAGVNSPRVAIASDGTSVVSWFADNHVFVTTGDRQGHFGPRHDVGRWAGAPPAVAADSGGRALVAWIAPDGVRVAYHSKTAGHWATHLVAAQKGSGLGAVTVGRDPRGGGGGWFVIDQQTASSTRHINTITLHPDGTRALEVQDLGAGSFSANARPLGALAVDSRGQATLALTSGPVPFDTRFPTVEIATGVHAGHFGQPTALPSTTSLSDPWVVAKPGGVALVAATEVSHCRDEGCFGNPFVWRVQNGVPARLGGPKLAQPRFASAPTVAPLAGGAAALVFQLRTATQRASRHSPVRAAVVGADGTTGPLQALTDTLATDPVALPLSGDRVLAVWTGSRGFGASLAGSDGHFHSIAAPGGPPPDGCCALTDMRTAGSWAAITWLQGTRIRIRIRHF